jgi:hypothetical protein
MLTNHSIVGRTKGILVAVLLLLTASGVAWSSTWLQVNQNGFDGKNGPTSDGTSLFVFDNALYASNEDGLFRMDVTSCISWAPLVTPTSANYTYSVVNGVLYAYGAGNELYQVTSGASLNPLINNWQAVVSFYPATPGGWAVGFVADGPQPFAWFNNQVYGAYRSGGAFSIYRSPQSGTQYMNWELVATNGFGDPNNHDLAFIVPFNGKVVAGTTNTRTVQGASFGDYTKYGTGVEVWQSATGDLGSWTQVNADGFGTEATLAGGSVTVRANQDIGCAQVYNGHLYVGTMSHYGAEVWQYDGSGITGWTNVTQPWSYAFSASPNDRILRNEAMAVFQGQLYLAEYYPSGNIGKYNGTSWTVDVAGPNPFSSQNGGIESLAVYNGVLYAATRHDPVSSGTEGDQVWATPFSGTPSLCGKLPTPILKYDPPKIRVLVPGQQIELSARISNAGDGPYQGSGTVELRKGDQLILSRDIPALGPQGSVEFPVLVNLSPGANAFSLKVNSGPGGAEQTFHFSLDGGAQ